LKTVQISDANLSVCKVPDFLAKHYGCNAPTRQTVYLWISKGRVDKTGKTQKLQVERRMGRMFTKESWVIAFVEKI
jgi:hypothetical protein